MSSAISHISRASLRSFAHQNFSVRLAFNAAWIRSTTFGVVPWYQPGMAPAVAITLVTWRGQKSVAKLIWFNRFQCGSVCFNIWEYIWEYYIIYIYIETNHNPIYLNNFEYGTWGGTASFLPDVV